MGSDVLLPYLGKIVRQTAIDRYRRKHSKKRFASEYAVSLEEMEDVFSDHNTPEREMELKWLEETVNSFIRSLPDDAQKVFIGRYYFFDSVKTIAGYCGISETNAKTLLYRTRRKLKDYLVKEGVAL